MLSKWQIHLMYTLTDTVRAHKKAKILLAFTLLPPFLFGQEPMEQSSMFADFNSTFLRLSASKMLK